MLFAEARELLIAGDASLACPLLEESQRLDAGLGTQYNLAVCYEQLGKLASAHALYREVAAAARLAGNGERELTAAARQNALEPRLSKLNIVVSPSQRGRVEVERDGAPVALAQLGLALPVDAGVHTIRVSGEGLEPWRTEIAVPADPGEHTVLVPVLNEKGLEPQLHSGVLAVPPRDQPPLKSFLAPTHRKVAVAAGSLGLLGVTAGTILGMRSISKTDESVRLGCMGDVCPTTEGVDARRQAQISSHVATASTIVGLTGLLTAAVLFLFVTTDDDDRASSNVTPRVGKNGGEVLWQSAF